MLCCMHLKILKYLLYDVSRLDSPLKPASACYITVFALGTRTSRYDSPGMLYGWSSSYYHDHRGPFKVLYSEWATNFYLTPTSIANRGASVLSWQLLC